MPSATFAAEDATPPAAAIREIRAALRFSEREKQILATVRDGGKTVEGNGFYMMMAKIAAFGTLNPAALSELDAPAAKNLTRDPDRYRYQPMRLNIRVFYVIKLSVEGKTISSNPYWPSEKPMWEIHATSADTPEPTAAPLIVYCAVPPPDLPQADEKRMDGRFAYKKSPRYMVAGIFYKYVERLDTGDDMTKQRRRRYPVILAWQMRKALPRPTKGPVNKVLAGVILLGLVLGIVIFIFLKKHIRRDKKQHDNQMFGNYRPLRETGTIPNDARDPDAQVDPDLVAAAEEYRKKHDPALRPHTGRLPAGANPSGGSESAHGDEKEGQ